MPILPVYSKLYQTKQIHVLVSVYMYWYLYTCTGFCMLYINRSNSTRCCTAFCFSHIFKSCSSWPSSDSRHRCFVKYHGSAVCSGCGIYTVNTQIRWYQTKQTLRYKTQLMSADTHKASSLAATYKEQWCVQCPQSVTVKMSGIQSPKELITLLKISSCRTGLFTVQPSVMVMRFGLGLKERDPGYNWLTLTRLSLRGRMRRSFIERSQLGGSGIWSECLLDVSLWRFSHWEERPLRRSRTP